MFVMAAVALSLAGWRLWWTPAGVARGYLCCVCRMQRGDRPLFGRDRLFYAASDFSDWYFSHIEPEHEHIWEADANVAECNLFGLCIDGKTGSHRKIPITLLSPSQHQRFLEHVTDVRALKQLFREIIAMHEYDEEPSEEGKGYVVVDAILDWERAGYPGTWDGWWNRHWSNWKLRLKGASL
jgi:hypothetical protein